MNKIYIKLLFLFWIVYLPINAQEEIKDFSSHYVNHYVNETPESPTASQFKKHGNVTVNTSSGTPNITIPIYTIVVDGVEVPISLSYDASGVRVNDISSTVGLKWTLQAGGGVYRTVKDRDDLQVAGSGWIRDNEKTHFETWWDSIQPSEHWFKNYQNQDFFIVNHIRQKDQWPDNFRYNFLKFSGEFLFKPNGGVVKNIKDEIDLSFHRNNNVLLTLFTANDQEGNKFYFSNTSEHKDINVSQSTTVPHYQEDVLTQHERDAQVTGWLLDWIETKNFNEIDFEYEKYLYEYTINNISDHLQIVNGCGECGVKHPWDCLSPNGSTSYVYPYHTTTNMKYILSSSLIKKIESENVRVDFIYEDSNVSDTGKLISGWTKRVASIIITDKITDSKKEFTFKYDVFEGDHRLKLLEIQQKGVNGKEMPPYVFNYNSTPLPEIGSKSQDYRGYYNGKENLSLLPRTEKVMNKLKNVHRSYKVYTKLGNRYFNESKLKAGVLNEIQYPTGGSSKFYYEANAIGENQEELILEERQKTISNMDYEVVGSDPFNRYHKYMYMTLMTINSPKGLMEAESLFDCPDCGCNCLEIPTLKIYKYYGDINDAPYQYLNNIGNDPQDFAFHLSFSGSIGSSSFEDKGPGLYLAILYLGGETAGVYDPSIHQVELNLKWFEPKRDLSGNPAFQQNYLGGLRVNQVVDFDTNNQPIHQKNYIYQDYYQEDTDVFRWDNYTKLYPNEGQFNGSPPFFIYSEIKETNPFLPQISGFCYTEVVTQTLAVGSVSNQKQILKEKYQPVIAFNKVSDSQITERLFYNELNQLVLFEEFSYHAEDLTPSLRFFSPSEKIYPISQTFPCNLYLWGEKTISGYSHRRIENKFYSLNNLLKSKKTTEIFRSGPEVSPMTTIETYNYNENRFIANTSIDTRYTAVLSNNNEIIDYQINNPNGEVIHTSYVYVDDPSINPPLSQNLPKKLPISKKVYNGSQKVLGQYFEYDSNGNIKRTYRFNKGVGSQSGGAPYVPSNYELDTKFSVNNEGKILQIEKEGGFYTSYIWGYNNTLPIAKLVGIRYAAIPPTLRDNAINASAAKYPLYSKTELNDALGSLRAGIPTAHVTTFIYNPLFGVVSITDPKGDVSTFEYDSFGRLIQIRDSKGNIVSENEYNYALEQP